MHSFIYSFTNSFSFLRLCSLCSECGQATYNPRKKFCCNTKVFWKRSGDACCGDTKKYNKRQQGCCNGEVYDPSTHTCCQRQLYDASTHICCKKQLHERDSNTRCCGTQSYDYRTHVCCEGKVMLPSRSRGGPGSPPGDGRRGGKNC